MSELFPGPPVPPGGDPESTESIDHSVAEREVRSRWTLQTARWRARELAEAVFGEDVPVRVEQRVPGASGHAFRALLRLSVPFRSLEQHRSMERVFTACAADDPVLSRVPLIYVFDPDPDRTPTELFVP
jgi:hypothetical protein